MSNKKKKGHTKYFGIYAEMFSEGWGVHTEASNDVSWEDMVEVLADSICGIYKQFRPFRDENTPMSSDEFVNLVANILAFQFEDLREGMLGSITTSLREKYGGFLH